MQSFWKKAFLILLCLNILAISVIIYLSLSPVKQVFQEQTEAQMEEKNLSIAIPMNGQELEGLIQQVMEKQGVPIEMIVGEKFQIFIPVSFQGLNSHLSIVGNPKVDQGGNLLIEISDISLGALNLPDSLALQIMSQSVDSYDYLTLSTNPNQIHLDFQKISEVIGLNLRVKEIYPKEDRYIFTIDVNKQELFNQKEFN
ncbi:YpmS family protein [Peptoniphilus sp. KCTC 25270]|uniref:DUF2140 family protein n=1 Tax=Peptoniphilus sp. KCTC 25270 TaxID=2897414 RepID=UPI001E45F015|nr:DUF2140 family protein [Peptoniphilus sp. KCTC 25270]MCD1147424.1 YpmS family protein [Peptoniphilus sp. KCTC 25270]